MAGACTHSRPSPTAWRVHESFPIRVRTARRSMIKTQVVLLGTGTPGPDPARSGYPSPTLLEHCSGCDVLIHEAYSQHTYDRVSRRWQTYRRKYHTSSKELAALVNRVKPRLLVLYHRSNAGGGCVVANPEGALLDEIRRLYKG